jgi:1-acyl-sn-glycerol-3-phosphate acyltransferase
VKRAVMMARVAPRLVRAPFPLGAPTWPTTVPRPPVERTTGVDYDASWARRYPARLARAAIVDWTLRPLVEFVGSPAVHGLDRLEGLESPAIFAANHHSHLDTALLLSVLPKRFRHRAAVAAAADYFFTTPARSAAAALVFAAIPIERSKVSRRSADLAAEALNAGWNLVIFPEGGRSPDGWGQEFRGGAGYLAVRCDKPVVPVHVAGTDVVLPKGAKKLRRAPVAVTFGRPLWAEEGEDARRFTVRIEAAVAALADEHASDWWQARRRAAAGTTPPLTGPEAPSWRRTWALSEKPSRRRLAVTSSRKTEWPKLD